MITSVQFSQSSMTIPAFENVMPCKDIFTLVISGFDRAAVVKQSFICIKAHRTSTLLLYMSGLRSQRFDSDLTIIRLLVRDRLYGAQFHRRLYNIRCWKWTNTILKQNCCLFMKGLVVHFHFILTIGEDHWENLISDKKHKTTIEFEIITRQVTRSIHNDIWLERFTIKPN